MTLNIILVFPAILALLVAASIYGIKAHDTFIRDRQKSASYEFDAAFSNYIGQRLKEAYPRIVNPTSETCPNAANVIPSSFAEGILGSALVLKHSNLIPIITGAPVEFTNATNRCRIDTFNERRFHLCLTIDNQKDTRAPSESIFAAEQGFLELVIGFKNLQGGKWVDCFWLTWMTGGSFVVYYSVFWLNTKIKTGSKFQRYNGYINVEN